MGRPPGQSAGFEARRAEIIDQAAKLFAVQGYAATGTVQLGQHVGLAKGALYHYIGSKEDLLVAIQERVLGPLLERAQVISELEASAVVKLRLISHFLMETIFQRLDYIWVYEHDYKHLTGERKELVLQQRRTFESIVRGYVIEAVETGALRDLDVRLATLQFLNLHNHSYQWVDPAGKYSATELSKAYCDTLFRGWAQDMNLDEVEKHVAALLRLVQLPSRA